MNTTVIAIILLHAFVGWVLCAVTIGIGNGIIALSEMLGPSVLTLLGR